MHRAHGDVDTQLSDPLLSGYDHMNNRKERTNLAKNIWSKYANILMFVDTAVQTFKFPILPHQLYNLQLNVFSDKVPLQESH